jgi:hypothetical protein
MQIEWHKVWRIAMKLYPDIHPSKLNQEQRKVYKLEANA